jgi:anti-sigma-K factor RskA
MVGMGTFMPGATGDVAVVVEGYGDGAEWAVTVEPEGGSDQPTSDPIAVSPSPA